MIAYVIDSRVEHYRASNTYVDLPVKSLAPGDFIWLQIVSTEATITPTDTAGNLYLDAGSSGGLKTWYAWNCLGHPENVVQVQTTGSPGQIWCSSRQFSGVDTASDPKDDSDIGGGTGTSFATPSLTLPGPAGVILAAVFAPATHAPGTGFTQDIIVDGVGNLSSDEYKLVSASEAATASSSTSGGWTIVGAMFRAAVASSGSPHNYFAQQQ